MLVGCGANLSDETAPARQIGYEFYSSLDSVPDTTGTLDEISAGVVSLFQRLQGKSEVFAALADWPDGPLQQQICAALEAHPDVKFQLIVDPARFLAATKDTSEAAKAKMPLLYHPQVRLANKENPRAGILNLKTKDAALHVNMLLATKLQPLGADDGSFTLLNSTSAFPNDSQPRISEAIRVYGDSSLYARCFAYWESLRGSKTEFGFITSHTYSNLHDHQAWFFPDIFTLEAPNAIAILSQLDAAMTETHQPAKVRLTIMGADDCHWTFFEQLVRLHIDHEADIKVVVCDTAAVAKEILDLMRVLPEGSVRLFAPRDSIHRTEMASRLLLIDGPYRVSENQPATPLRLCFLLGEDYNLTAQRNHSSIWLRISDKRLFEDAEKHWKSIWDLADDKPFDEARRIRNLGACTQF